MLLFGQREQVPRREPTRETRGTETAGEGARTAQRRDNQPAHPHAACCMREAVGWGPGHRVTHGHGARCTHAQAGDGGSGAGVCVGHDSHRTSGKAGGGGGEEERAL